MFSVVSVCQQRLGWGCPMWPLPMMHWTSLFSPPWPRPASSRHGSSLYRGSLYLAPVISGGDHWRHVQTCSLWDTSHCCWHLVAIETHTLGISRVLNSKVPCLEGVGSCTVRSNALWVMVTWEPPIPTSIDRQTELKKKLYSHQLLWWAVKMTPNGNVPDIVFTDNIFLFKNSTALGGYSWHSLCSHNSITFGFVRNVLVTGHDCYLSLHTEDTEAIKV